MQHNVHISYHNINIVHEPKWAKSSETIILTPKDFSKIKIRFDFAQDDTTADLDPIVAKATAPIKHFDQELVLSILTNKLNGLKDYLQNFTQHNSTDDSILIEPYTTTVTRPECNLNITLDTIQIVGISQFTISDIATNIKSKKVSALLRFGAIRVSLYYKVNGDRLEDELKELTKPYSDKGKITYTVHGWRTTFSGKVVDIDANRTKLGLAGFGMRSHYNFFEPVLESFVHGEDRNQLIDIGRFISTELMRKTINGVDDHLENIVLEQLNVREMGTWANFRDGGDQYEEDGHLMMMESKIHEQTRRRRKRQVPCEVGEELDEYVDSLFRFLKRLVRVMEPFNLPNATIELEEYNLQIFLHSGGATRAYTFERKRPAWVLCQNETTTLGLTVGIEELRVHYKYRVIQDWKLLFDGDLEAQIRRPKAQVQITQLNPPENEDEEGFGDGDEEQPQVQQRIDRLKVWKPGQIVVLIRGLGNLSSALSMIINQMLSDTSTLDPVIRMIETDGVVAANDMLKNVSIPIFSII
ncbi:hypothetical protein BLOT_015060 [Blomia tropicalis]|nr:hypothetical protein BLOT_015060 [Blomia tropicalis]